VNDVSRGAQVGRKKGAGSGMIEKARREEPV